MLRVGTRVYNDFLFKFMKKHETEIIDEFIRINPKSSRFISDAIDSDGKEMRSTNRWAAFWQQPAWADQFQALGLAWRSFSGNATFESLNFVGDGIEFGLSPKAVLQGGSAAPRARQARATRGTLTTARQERKERGERRGRKTRKSVLKFTKTSTSTLFLKVGGGGTETVSKQDEGENFFNVTETAADWHRDS